MKSLSILIAALLLGACYDGEYAPTYSVPVPVYRHHHHYHSYGKPPAHVYYAPPRNTLRVVPYRPSGRRR